MCNALGTDYVWQSVKSLQAVVLIVHCGGGEKGGAGGGEEEEEENEEKEEQESLCQEAHYHYALAATEHMYHESQLLFNPLTHKLPLGQFKGVKTL